MAKVKRDDSFLDLFLNLFCIMVCVWRFYNLKEILNVLLKDYIVLISVKLNQLHHLLKTSPDKLSIPAAFSGLVSVFKISSSEVDEKVNFWFSVFRNPLQWAKIEYKPNLLGAWGSLLNESRAKLA